MKRRADLDAIAAALRPSGLCLRGGFNVAAGETLQAGPSGARARAVVLVGNAGAGYWPQFQRWLTAQTETPENPLDDWCRQMIGAVAAAFGAWAVSPADRPYHPFQQWAMRAEGLRASPLGVLIHPEYGLWHAYRGALLLDVEIDEASPREVIHLCDLCVGKPCRKQCPVEAHAGEGFLYEACLGHVRGARGAACRDGGCLDRNACPYGEAYRYPEAVRRFHMQAFMR